MDLPDDPFPDLTLVRLAELRLDPSLQYLCAVQQLFPDANVVLMAEVIERTDEGIPRLVRIVA